MNAELNPETIDSPSAVTSTEWYLQRFRVFVRKGATLPPVDLESGESGEGVVMRKTIHERLNTITHIKYGSGAIALVLLFLGLNFGFYLMASVAAGVSLWSFWPWMNARVGKLNENFTTFYHYASARRIRRFKNWLWIFVILFSMTLLGYIHVPRFFPWTADLFRSVISVMILVTLRVLLLSRATKLGITTEGKGWVSIGPVHPDAEEFLNGAKLNQLHA